MKKPAQLLFVPGKTEAERFGNAVRTMASVPKAEIDRREAEWHRAHPKDDATPPRENGRPNGKV